MIGGSYYELDRPVVNGPHEGEIACVAVNSAGDIVIDLQTLFSRCWAQDYLTVTLDATPGTVFLGGLNSTGAALSIVAAFPARKPQRILSKGRRYLVGRMLSGSGVLRIWASSLAPLTVPVVASPFVDFSAAIHAVSTFTPVFDVLQQRDFSAAIHAVSTLTGFVNDAAASFVDFSGTIHAVSTLTPVFDVLQQVDFSAAIHAVSTLTGVVDDASVGNVDFTAAIHATSTLSPGFEVLQQRDFSAAIHAVSTLTPGFDVLQQKDFSAAIHVTSTLTGALIDSAAGGFPAITTSGVTLLAVYEAKNATLSGSTVLTVPDSSGNSRSAMVPTSGSANCVYDATGWNGAAPAILIPYNGSLHSTDSTVLAAYNASGAQTTLVKSLGVNASQTNVIYSFYFQSSVPDNEEFLERWFGALGYLDYYQRSNHFTTGAFVIGSGAQYIANAVVEDRTGATVDVYLDADPTPVIAVTGKQTGTMSAVDFGVGDYLYHTPTTEYRFRVLAMFSGKLNATDLAAWQTWAKT